MGIHLFRKSVAKENIRVLDKLYEHRNKGKKIVAHSTTDALTNILGPATKRSKLLQKQQMFLW